MRNYLLLHLSLIDLLYAVCTSKRKNPTRNHVQMGSQELSRDLSTKKQPSVF